MSKRSMVDYSTRLGNHGANCGCRECLDWHRNKIIDLQIKYEGRLRELRQVEADYKEQQAENERMRAAKNIATAVQMLRCGWTVRIVKQSPCVEIEWYSPRGISGSDYLSRSLDLPPIGAIQDAIRNNEIESETQ